MQFESKGNLLAELTLLPGTSVFFPLRVFTCLDEAHPHYGRSSVLLKVYWFIYLFKKYLFIYLAALGLSCGMWDLQLWHVESSSLTRDQTRAPCVGTAES